MGKKLMYLFIHGAGGTSNKWRKLPEHIRRESIIVDLPGRNDIDKLSTNSIEAIAQELNKQVVDDVIVVGHSMGGIIAIELASINQKVKGIVLVSSHYRLPVDQKLLTTLKEGVFPKGLHFASYHKNVDPELLLEEQNEIEKVSIETTYLDFQATHQYVDGEKKLKNLDIPILVINGKEDRLLPKTANSDVPSSGSNIQVRLLEETGHHVMLERPEVFIKQLQEFRDEVIKH